MIESLKDKVISGAFWNGMERFGTAFFLFVSNLILARLLSPDDFGCIGMLMVFIAISDAIIEGGLGAALVQRKNVTPEDYSTIFIWNIITSIILYGLLFLLAPLISSFYKIESLTLLLRVLGLGLLFSSICVVQVSILCKQLQFKKLAKIGLSSVVVGTVSGIICAFCGFGVWSLVVKSVVSSVVACCLYWMNSVWSPLWVFSRESFRSLFGYGSFLFLTGILNSIYQNVISLVIGKSLSAATLGFFTQARKLEDIPRTAISAVVGNVTFPAFSSIQDQRVKLVNTFRKTSEVLSYVNFSVTILFIIIAKPLILLLFSEKWMQSIPYFQVICIYGFIMSNIELNQGIIKAIGKSNLLFYTGVIRRGVAILLIVIGAFWGMRGILIGYVIGQYISFVIVAYPLKYEIGYSLTCQVRDLFPSFCIAVITGLIVFGISSFLINASHLITIIVQSLFFLLILFSLSYVIKPRGFVYLKDTVLNYIVTKWVKRDHS